MDHVNHHTQDVCGWQHSVANEINRPTAPRLIFIWCEPAARQRTTTARRPARDPTMTATHILIHICIHIYISICQYAFKPKRFAPRLKIRSTKKKHPSSQYSSACWCACGMCVQWSCVDACTRIEQMMHVSAQKLNCRLMQCRPNVAKQMRSDCKVPWTF